MRILTATGQLRRLRLCAVVLASLVFARTSHTQQIQIGFAAPRQPATLTAAQVAVISGPVAARLEQARALAADKQWEEVVSIYRELAADETDRVAELGDGRYSNLRDYCHLQISHLPDEALAIYRRHVDPLAEQWYRDGMAARDERLLRRIVEELFCSSWGDDALLALGELALERGDYAAARRWWQQVSRLLRDPAGTPAWIALHNIDLNTYWLEVERRWFDRPQSVAWLAYPDSSVELADVRARLIVVSMRAGELERAQLELQVFRRLHPNASGRLGGQVVPYVTALERLLNSAEDWRDEPRNDWPTFAGAPTRLYAAPALPPTLVTAWHKPVPIAAPSQNDRLASQRIVIGGAFGGGLVENATPEQPPVRESQKPLSTFPIVVDGRVIFADAGAIRAVDLRTGQPAITESGVLYRHEFSDDSSTQARINFGAPTVGAPRYTLTAVDDVVYSRVGDPTTARTDVRGGMAGDRLVGLELSRDGMLALRARPESAEWSFDGVPVSDGQRVFVAMRHSGVTPHAHVACFDAATGNQLWRTSIATADTPAAGRGDEITHNLLTLVGDRIYFNTNLGIVAAVDADDGRIVWLHRYDRGADQSLLEGRARSLHYHRDPSPCLHHQGLLIVAPSDSPAVFALDADTGKRVWTNENVADLLHLLGVVDHRLIVSGNRLHSVDVQSGEVRFTWPESERAGIRGIGRGVIAGKEVFWPTRNEIYVLHAVTGERTRPPISLTSISDHGANLAAADNHLIIAAHDRLTALGPTASPRTNHLGD